MGPLLGATKMSASEEKSRKLEFPEREGGEVQRERLIWSLTSTKASWWLFTTKTKLCCCQRGLVGGRALEVGQGMVFFLVFCAAGRYTSLHLPSRSTPVGKHKARSTRACRETGVKLHRFRDLEGELDPSLFPS